MIYTDESFLYQVYAIVEEIPVGKVATYGQISKLVGKEKNSRLIGKIMRISNLYGDFPCHRVVNSNGRLVPGWDEQKLLLENENVIFKKSGNVDLSECQWKV